MISDALMQELRGKLEEEQKRLRDELGQLGHRTDVKGVEDYDVDPVEYERDDETNAVEVGDDAARDASVDTLESRLKDVNDALARMESGEYGKDEKTGEELSEDRLRANPAARTAA